MYFVFSFLFFLFLHKKISGDSTTYPKREVPLKARKSFFFFRAPEFAVFHSCVWMRNLVEEEEDVRKEYQSVQLRKNKSEERVRVCGKKFALWNSSLRCGQSIRKCVVRVCESIPGMVVKIVIWIVGSHQDCKNGRIVGDPTYPTKKHKFLVFFYNFF